MFRSVTVASHLCFVWSLIPNKGNLYTNPENIWIAHSVSLIVGVSLNLKRAPSYGRCSECLHWGLVIICCSSLWCFSVQLLLSLHTSCRTTCGFGRRSFSRNSAFCRRRSRSEKRPWCRRWATRSDHGLGCAGGWTNDSQFCLGILKHTLRHWLPWIPRWRQQWGLGRFCLTWWRCCLTAFLKLEIIYTSVQLIEIRFISIFKTIVGMILRSSKDLFFTLIGDKVLPNSLWAVISFSRQIPLQLRIEYHPCTSLLRSRFGKLAMHKRLSLCYPAIFFLCFLARSHCTTSMIEVMRESRHRKNSAMGGDTTD